MPNRLIAKDIESQLIDKLGLTDRLNKPASFILDGVVRPVISVDSLLSRILFIDKGTFNVTGTGNQEMFEVPTNKRWRVMFGATGTLTGTWTLTFLSAGIGGVFVPVKTQSAAADLYYKPADMSFVLEGGWKLIATISAVTVAGTGYRQFVVEETDIG